MEHIVTVRQDYDKRILFESKGREILRIEEIRAHMLHCPDISIRGFEREESAGTFDDTFFARKDVFETKVRLHQKNGLIAINFEGHVNGRENKEGYPYVFALDHSIDMFLTLDEDAPFEANYQHKAWWIRPAFGNSLPEIPEKTQLLIRKTEATEDSFNQSSGEKYEVFLAVCGSEFRTDLAGSTGGIHLRLSSFRTNRKQLRGIAMIYGCGEDPYEIIHSCVKFAKELNNNAFLELGEKRYPEVFEGMGWCTWDSLGQDVSEAAIFQKMEEFREKDIRIPWILIDDGWSDVDREHLTLRGLDADPVHFPNGLAGTVKVLKEKYGVSYVGIWQAFKGYWYGIEENSDAHLAMAPYLTRYGNGELSVKPTEEASFGFWNHWHRELRQKGIDFVKIDGQGSVPTMLHGDTAENAAIRNLYAGLEASVFLNFDGNLINCMGMAPENVWNRCKSAISRASDDYTPTVTGSIVEHTLQNCYNNVYQGDLYFGDWDMFWSEHEEAQFSSILRAISGGPVYTSDALGHTRKELLDKLMREDGKLLRCDSVARPTLDCLTENVLRDGGVLKIYNTGKEAIYVACFAWDISGNTAEGKIRIKDIPVMKSGSYLVYDPELHCLGRCDDNTDYVFQMNSRQAKIFELVAEDQAITVLGMTNKYISLSGVGYSRKLRNMYLVTVNCRGMFSFVSKGAIDRIYLDGEIADFEKEKDVYTVEVKNEGGEIEIIFL
ncbi:MAG: hypothetical protein IJW67_10510 [Blautia sp.]|nr:hypothetical protein [Blautia sp.]